MGFTYILFRFTRHNIFFSIVTEKGKLLYTCSLGYLGLTNFKLFNIRYINLLIDNKKVRTFIKYKHNIIIKIVGRFKHNIILRILNIFKKLKLNILGVLVATLTPYNGCKLKS